MYHENVESHHLDPATIRRCRRYGLDAVLELERWKSLMRSSPVDVADARASFEQFCVGRRHKPQVVAAALMILAMVACGRRETVQPTTDNQQPATETRAEVKVRRAVESSQGSTAIESAPATSGDVGRPIVPAAPSRPRDVRPRTMQSFGDIAPSSTQPAPVITVPIEIRGTEILIPCDFHHGPQRMNVRLTTAEAPPEVWRSAAWRQMLQVDASGTFPVMVRRRRRNVDSDVMTIRVPAGFPATASFGVNDLFQHGDVIVIPWSPGLMARRNPDRTIEGVVVSIVENASGDPVTRPAGVMP